MKGEERVCKSREHVGKQETGSEYWEKEEENYCGYIFVGTPQHLVLVLQLWHEVNLKMYEGLCIKSACRVLVQPLCMSAHPTHSPAGIANASITTATAPSSSVPLRDLLQQLGVCEELQ